jgi:hypothetical protein
MPTDPLPPSGAELEPLSKHVCYEMVGAARLKRYWPPQLEAVDVELANLVSRSMWEAGVIHIRNVVDFLVRTKPDRDTVYALHYIPDWPDQRNALVFTDEEKVILHRFVAHIGATRVRTRLNWVPWLMDERLDRVLIGCRRFIDDLPSSSRPWFESADLELRAAGL